MKKICVIGAGASGMVAAISAARSGASVALYEKNAAVGRKILQTGNGKCNFTNEDMDTVYFRSSTESTLIKSVLSRFDEKDTINFFENLGIKKRVRNGGLYPYSETAVSIVDVLSFELERLEVKMVFECPKIYIKKKDHGYDVSGTYYDAVIVATGGKAVPKSGSTGDGYWFAENFGLKVVKPLPALTQIKSSQKWFKDVAGVRVEAELSLYIDGSFVHKSHGELQLTDYGISGICTFEISGLVSRATDNGHKCRVEINLLPGCTFKEALSMLEKRKEIFAVRAVGEMFTGLFNKKLSDMLIREAGIKPQKKAGSLDDKELNKLAHISTQLVVEADGVNDFAKAQVTSGGVSLDELTEDMEAKKAMGLFFVGEVVDVDGICGGYNLQWAWATGYLAGKAASID